MLPDFNENGYLPPGLHPASLEEIDQRFGRESELRRAEMESLRWLVELAKRAGVQRIIANGSFVTDKLEPNDVDCVLLSGDKSKSNPLVEQELASGLPFLSMKLVEEEEFDFFVGCLFATDRNRVPKGMVEVKL